MSDKLNTSPSSPTSKFVRKTLAQLDKIANNNHRLSATHDQRMVEGHDDMLPEDEFRETERQEKLERLARNECTGSTSSDDSTTSAPYREIEMGGARKLSPDEVGKMFD